MADESLKTPAQSDPTAAADPAASNGAAAIPVFKADEFLAGKKVRGSNVKAAAAQTETETLADTISESPSTVTQSAAPSTKATPDKARDKPAQVVKRGGVSFFTALAMSTLATAGGAYLALFVQARPDVLQQAGIGQFLPQAAPVGVAQNGGAGSQALAQRVATIEAQLAALQSKVSAMDAKDGFTAPPPAEGASAPTKFVPSPSPDTKADAAATAAASPATTPSVATTPTPPPTGAVVADVGLLKSELAGIGGRVTAIETRLAALDPTGAGGAVIAGLQADIASLKATITALQQQVAATPSPAVTMSVVNLAEAAGRSGPFLTEFETLRAAMGNGPEVAALEAFARTGVPTRTMLQERFATLGPAMAAAATTAQKEGGMVLWFRSIMSSMIKVTPAPNANGKAADDVLLRAKTKLDQGDLSGSVDDLATLQNAPAPVTEWMAMARKRIDLESRLSAVRGVASRPPPPPPTSFQAPAATTPPAATAAAPVAPPAVKGTNP